MSEKGVLITGIAGFIGSHLAERLIGRGDRVAGLDNLDSFYDPALKRGNLEAVAARGELAFHEGDVRDLEGLLRLLRTHRPDVVVHLAARAGVRPSIREPLLYQDVNVRGTNAVLEACRQVGVAKVVFASSSSVYGNSGKIPFHENDPVDHPVSPYAATKRAGELIAHTYHHLHGLSVFCMRFFTVYGPRQRPEMAIARFTRLIDAGQPVPRFGDGSTRRDYTYIDDCVDGLEAAVDRVDGFDIFNLGESDTTTLAELIDLIAGALGKPATVEELPMQPGDVVATYADIDRARTRLGYDPRTPVDEGVRRYVEWYRDQKAGEAA